MTRSRAQAAASRVVTVTSVAVERDSRAYRFATSAAQLGHESVVVEGERSKNLGAELPFELRSPPEAEASIAATKGTDLGLPGPSLLTRIAERLPKPLAIGLAAVAYPINRYLIHPVAGLIYTVRVNVNEIRNRTEGDIELLPDADVYSLHAFWQYRAVKRKLDELDAALLYDVHDALWEEGMNLADTFAMRASLRVFEAIDRRCVRRADGFSTVSAGVADLLAKRFGRRPEVIRNCHDLRGDVPSPKGIREVCGVSSDDFLLVMTGNWKPGQVIREALTALAALPDRVHLAFVGRDHEQSEELVREIGLEDRVHLLRPRPPTEVVDFISGADASPILYRKETLSYKYSLPNGFFHAIAAGLPVLYPDLDEMRALGREHSLGIEFDPDEPASIESAFRGVVEDPAAAARYKANVEKARQVLNWEHEERILTEMLESALNKASL